MVNENETEHMLNESQKKVSNLNILPEKKMMPQIMYSMSLKWKNLSLFNCDSMVLLEESMYKSWVSNSKYTFSFSNI